MSVVSEPLAQARGTAPQQALRAVEVATQPLTVAEALALPALNGPEIVCRLWDISRGHFHRLDHEGAFDFLKVVPSVGPRRFSGILIARYLCQEPLHELSFGRKRGR